MAKFCFDGQALADLKLLTVALQRAVPVGHISRADALGWAVRHGLAELMERECQQPEEVAASLDPAEQLPAPEHPASVDRGRLTERQQDAEVRGGSPHRALEVRRYLVPPRIAPLPFPQIALQPRLL